MKLSSTRAIQWVGILAVLVFVVALRYEAPSEAKKTVNAPFESRTDQGMLGYWKLDDGTGTNATDASGNGNTLAMTGSPSWTTGEIGPYALDFSGSGQYLSVADPSSGVLDFVDGADFTISGWFNRDTAAADHTIVAKKNDQTTSAGYVVWIDNNGSTDYLSAEISDGTDTYSAIGTTDLSSTGWHHFAVVLNDSSGLYVYLDGKLDGSTTTSTTSINSLANALAFRIGAESDAGVPFDGKIDDVKLYGKTLSASDVLTLYQTTVPATPASTAGLDSGLVGHWTFDGPDVNWGDTSNEIKDVSGRGNHGDAVGSLSTTSAVRGKLGQGLSFNGSSDGINTTFVPGVHTMTISFWMNANDTNNDYYPVSINQNSNDKLWTLRVEDANFSPAPISIEYVPNDGNNLSVTTTTSPIVARNWYHVVAVTNITDIPNRNGTFTLYVNGSNVPLDTSTFTGWSDDGGTRTPVFTIGVDRLGYFKGIIDDVRFYNRALSSTEVTDLYNMGK